MSKTSEFDMAGSAVGGMRVAITGAAGSLAADIIPALLEVGVELVCVDRTNPTTDLGLEWRLCSITDREELKTAFVGCDAVIHLAGIPLEDEWERILENNIDGTQAVLDTALHAGVEKVVLASSIHATGFVGIPADEAVPADVRMRPNTFYGVSKAALEALGSYYHDRHAMDVICLRIASRFSEPRNVRMLSTWLSPEDAGRLFIAALGPLATGFRTIWGVSRNTRGYLSAEAGEAIGFHALDDAEVFAEQISEAAKSDPLAAETMWDREYLGGVFSSDEPPLQPHPADSPQPHQTEESMK
ncbi:MAG: NAD(P)-dependent oxidoreductase [Micrococcaceae bacterium]|nr:NAD(P)-dependent oxidoreductase [Micrococcaceae bacterium]